MAQLSIEPNPRVRFEVVVEAPDFAVVAKPPGVPTQPGKGHAHDTLLNGLFARWGPRLQNLGKARDFGLLHRLDRGASGLVAVGLTASGYDALRAAFVERKVEKRYWCLVYGAPEPRAGVIRKPIQEVIGRQKTARVSSAGKPAVTAYRTLRTAGRPPRQSSLIECRIGTGRLHQIRVHMASLGCPVLGDDLYAEGPPRRMTPRLALHAFLLRFADPATGETVEARSAWPGDLLAAMRRLGFASAPFVKDDPAAPASGDEPTPASAGADETGEGNHSDSEGSAG